ncbi:MAG: ferrous iron transport protein B, partial [Candidatus Omnitrophota bacterium]
MNKIIRAAIAGNPNSGKTTIFNAMTGAHQKVGNYAGVTVDKKEGRRSYAGCEFIIYDLPGTYSLTAYSMDEMIARDFIIEGKPDVIIDVLDSTNIERNLYLCLQFQELGVPVVAALNIIDQAEKMGIRIDEKVLSSVLGIPFLKTAGASGKGINELLDAVIAVVEKKEKPQRCVSYGPELEREITAVGALLERDPAFAAAYSPRWTAIKLIEKDAHAYHLIENHSLSAGIKFLAGESIRRIETHFGRDAEIAVSEQRYGYIHGAVTEAVRREIDVRTVTERADSILLNRYLGLPVFVFILWAVFQATFKLGEYPVSWLETFFSRLSAFASGVIPAGLPRSLAVDGIIAGVGGVFSFVPLVIILFLCISILEDTGYMARTAFIMDRFLHIFGLHGQSFMPMMLGFGCSVAAVMAARTLKSPRDRIITILIIPFMSCGAKLPVYVLLAGAFFYHNPGNAVLAVYLTGAVLAVCS